MNKKEKDYLQKELNILNSQQKNDISESNECFREISKQLILVATVILSVSAFVMEPDTIDDLDIIDKSLIFSMWLLIITSINAGIFQFIIDYNHARKWANFREKVINDINYGIAKAENLIVISRQHKGDLQPNSNNYAISLQLTSMLFSFVFMVLFIYRLLF